MGKNKKKSQKKGETSKGQASLEQGQPASTSQPGPSQDVPSQQPQKPSQVSESSHEEHVPLSQQSKNQKKKRFPAEAPQQAEREESSTSVYDSSAFPALGSESAGRGRGQGRGRSAALEPGGLQELRATLPSTAVPGRGRGRGDASGTTTQQGSRRRPQQEFMQQPLQTVQQHPKQVSEQYPHPQQASQYPPIQSPRQHFQQPLQQPPPQLLQQPPPQLLQQPPPQLLQQPPPQLLQQPPPQLLQQPPPQLLQQPPPQLLQQPPPQQPQLQLPQQPQLPPPQQSAQQIFPPPSQRSLQQVQTPGQSPQGPILHGSSLVPVSRGGLQIPVRETFGVAGTKGRPTTIKTNHLELNLKRLRTQVALHYDVSIDPDKPKRLLRRAVEEFRLQKFAGRYPAFDGRRNMYSATELPFDHKSECADTIRVLDHETQKEREFKIVIKFATYVDLTSLSSYMRSGTSLEAPQQAIQVLDVVLRCAPALRFVPVGRSYFTPPTGIQTLGDGYEIWYGLFQSVTLGWQPFVNVDVVHKGFPTNQPVISVIRELFGDQADLSRDLRDYQLIELRKFLVGLKIDYQIPDNPSSRRTYKVNDIVESPSRLTFDHGDRRISVQQYFEREKKIHLRYRNLPCLHVGSKTRPNPIYVPLEFCTVVPGQVTQKKLNERQTATMIKHAATNTNDRIRKIHDALNRARFNENPQVTEFGLQVNENFKEVKARVLEPPKLEYHPRESPITPMRGVWQPKKFLDGKKLDKWIVLVLDGRVPDDKIGELIYQFQSQGAKLGMSINKPQPHYKMDSRRIKSELEHFLRKKAEEKFELVVVVVPERGNDYAFVKQTAELAVGLLTQCIKSSTVVRRMNYTTAQNILLKVNSKLNGINHVMHSISRPRIFETPIMIVGADVTHPSPDETRIPSVAAVCASHDPKAFKYNTQLRLQPPRMEIIADLERIMKQQLLYFYKITRQKPQRIFFYRDGVSEGQFQQVLNNELTAIRAACSKLEQNYKPPITFLVVQKRHHTRFFPIHEQDCDGKNRNVMPGTIVDTTITHPTERDFYLVSHASIQGVSRPTKYHCLWDDNKLTEDQLEELTYYLCHMFSRCTRSVSYPAPTYYAHLAASRARAYLSGQNLDNFDDSHLQTQLFTKFQHDSPMFFV